MLASGHLASEEPGVVGVSQAEGWAEGPGGRGITGAQGKATCAEDDDVHGGEGQRLFRGEKKHPR